MGVSLGQTILQHFTKFIQDMNWLKIIHFNVNSFTGKVKQPNWNKTNEMNISLASITIFLGQKKEHRFCISKHCDKPGQHNNVLSYQHSRHKKVTKWDSCRVAGWVGSNVYGLPPKTLFQKKYVFSNLWGFGVNHWCIYIYNIIYI